MSKVCRNLFELCGFAKFDKFLTKLQSYFLWGGTSAERSWLEVLFLETRIFLREKLRYFPRKVGGPSFCGSEKFPPNFPQNFQEPRKGGFSKGVSAESSVTAKETKNTQGYWPQQYTWHSERHGQERHTFCKNHLPKTPLSLLLKFPPKIQKIHQRAPLSCTV